MHCDRPWSLRKTVLTVSNMVQRAVFCLTDVYLAPDPQEVSQRGGKAHWQMETMTHRQMGLAGAL